ncbi:Os03g0387500, partial [Oryza sativa Japonica Group]
TPNPPRSPRPPHDLLRATSILLPVASLKALRYPAARRCRSCYVDLAAGFATGTASRPARAGTEVGENRM